VIQTARSVGDNPIYLCGFSLGGNFALRIGRKWSLSPPPGIDLRHIAAISPVIDPAKATDEIDKHPLIRCYFMRKWRRSLLKKQQLFPKYYDLDDVCALKTVRQMTEKLLARYSPYSTADEYFAGYTIHSHDLESLAVPTTIITASDDPILPVSDYHALSLGQRMRMIIHDYGGHNGFIRNFAGKTWYESYLSKVFADRSPKKTHDV